MGSKWVVTGCIKTHFMVCYRFVLRRILWFVTGCIITDFVGIIYYKADCFTPQRFVESDDLEMYVSFNVMR